MALSVTPDFKKGNEQFRLLVDAVKDHAIYLLDPAGQIVSWNQGAERIHGYRSEEVLGLSYDLFFRDEDRKSKKSRELLETARREGKAVAEGWRLRKGGIPFLAEVVISPIWGENGVLEGYGKITRDITQKKALEEMKARQSQYQEMERQFRALSDSAPVLIWMASPDGACTYFNKTWLDFTGRSQEEEGGDGWAAGLHAEDRIRILEIFRQSIRVRAPFRLDFRLKRRDGSFRWMLANGAPRQDADGLLLGFVVSAVDIHDRKELEDELQRSRHQLDDSEERYRQAQKMEAVGRLAGGIAHDFNNLLTAINGYSELGLGMAGAQNRELADSLMEIREAGRRAAALTQQLLAFSRKQILSPRRIDLNTVVGRMENMLRRLIGEDVHLAFHPAPDLPPIHADMSQVEQVILNLSVNARDAMPAGGNLTIQSSLAKVDALEAATRPECQPGEYVVLTMMDSGHGMEPETLARIFEPFFTTKEAGKGTGLGLAMVYGVVKQSGGFIEVTSRLGQGTTFQIGFPAARDAGASTEEAGPDARGDSRGQGGTIIIVEDEESVRNLVVKILSDQGYACLPAENGDQAMELIKTRGGTVNLLLSDVVLKGMSGPALAERLRAIHPSLRVLYMSGYTDQALGRHGLTGEGVEILNKPFTVQSLLARVNSILQP